jgi:hypothetical protein
MYIGTLYVQITYPPEIYFYIWKSIFTSIGVQCKVSEDYADAFGTNEKYEDSKK